MKIIYDNGELEIVISRGKSKKGFIFADSDEVDQIYDGIEAYRDVVADLTEDTGIDNLRVEFELKKEDC